MSDVNNGEANPQLLYTPEEAAVALRIGRTHLYQLKSAKQITYKKCPQYWVYKDWKKSAIPT